MSDETSGRQLCSERDVDLPYPDGYENTYDGYGYRPRTRPTTPDSTEGCDHTVAPYPDGYENTYDGYGYQPTPQPKAIARIKASSLPATTP